ncbi:tetratricopeptide repeat protein [Kamptonema animale CS-326]|jgi:chemotaxis protein methyltransferase CheR|uniref:CheR family methyltransferase n=1 Tax=Kamptonema animale TaxID=92934 RepID=UPI00232F18D3|nr:CheR family methyltransferase [Kamptonema animale]MDB9514889.1 tetratricopeptide repeat protein [Kamptonema animale CS-326]
MNDRHLELFIQLIANNIGLHIRPQDRTALSQKIVVRMKNLNLSIPENYYQLLEADTEQSQKEWRKLIILLTTTESYFLRDVGQFKLLEKVILPEIIEYKNQLKETSGMNPSIRIWSAGCSTGEEAYSLAILIQKLLPNWENWNILILGTDINEEALDKAKQGSYSPWSFRLVNPGLQQQYFNQHKNEWIIEDKLVKNVKFRYGNLVKDDYPNLSDDINNMDLILCRNVFVYFEAQYIALVLKKFYNTLRTGGYLMTSHAELHGQVLDQFRAIIFPESVIYQRSDVGQKEVSRMPPYISNIGESTNNSQQELSGLEPSNSTPKKLAETEIKPTAKLEPRVSPRGEDSLLSPKLPVPVLFPISNTTETPKPLKVRELVDNILRSSDGKPEENNTVNTRQISSSLTVEKERQRAGINLLQEAEAFCKNKTYFEAIKKAEQVIELYPHNFKAYYLLAEIYANLGKYEQAINYCKKAIQVDSLSVFPYHLLAHIAEENGDLEAAKNLLKKVIYLCPSFISAYLDLGNIYAGEGNVKRAKKMYATSCELLKILPPDSLIEQQGKITASELLKYVKAVLVKLSIQ